MSYVTKTEIANKNNYGVKRQVTDIKYIVFHFTANDGDTDEANGKYFRDNIVKASAHYFVDDDSVTQSVPDDYVAYSVGGKRYKDCNKTGGGKLYGIAKNANTLNIEMCDTKRDGKIMATDATLDNAVQLCKTLMKKYNVDINHVIRHFDVNGKHCPAYFMDETAWTNFKKRLDVSTSSVNTPSNDASSVSYMVKVSIDDLNIRMGPGTNYVKNGKIKRGAYTIIAEKSGRGSKLGWGKLKSGAGWISLDYVTKI